MFFETMNSEKFLKISLRVLIVLAFGVILLGAFTRLSDAGLGCPDWPGCYGQWVAPKGHFKGWIEMLHRYAAGTVVLLVIVSSLFSWRLRKQCRSAPKWALAMLVVIFFQASLGMLTVTLNLLPIIVVGHLIGGFMLLMVVWLFTLSLKKEKTKLENFPRRSLSFLKCISAVGVVLISTQIFLGGWVSTNYAALICPTFPKCQGAWWPIMNFKEAFHFFLPIGPNYEGGVLDNASRVAIQMMHRCGAVVVFGYVLFLVGYLTYQRKTLPKHFFHLAMILWILILSQLVLGIINVVRLLPLPVALLHNGCAALLLLSVVTLCYRSFSASEKF